MPLFSIADTQLIVYGAPGTGKSYGINDTLSSLGFDLTNEVERVVFHKDYTYSDFIGCLMPNNGATGLDYIFEPGPFTIALEKALESPKAKICLLIEEMNRGNCGEILSNVGKIDFPRTIKKCRPTILDEGPLYLPYITRAKKIADENLVRNTQILVLNDIAKKVGWLIGFNIHIPPMGISAGLNKSLISKLKVAKNNSYNTRKLKLIVFRLMMILQSNSHI